jgi:hypothetical protein
MAIPKPGGAPTKMPKRPRSEGSTPTYTVNTSKKPRDFTGPGIYREALTNAKIAILKENYTKDKPSEEEDQVLI